jgi:hypothetical protein
MKIAPETDLNLEETLAVKGSNSPIGSNHRKEFNPSKETLLREEFSRSGRKFEGTPVPDGGSSNQGQFFTTEALSKGFIP